MSKIPYRFVHVPHELVAEEFLKDPPMMSLVVWMMKRVSLVQHKVPLVKQGTTLVLEPYEIIFGRQKTSKEIGLSEGIIRTRVSRLIKLGYLERVTTKSTNTFTVYRIVKESFKTNREQVNPQDNPQNSHQDCNQTNHKRDTKIREEEDLKGTSNDSKRVNITFLSERQKEGFIALQAYAGSYDLKIGETSLVRWIAKYDLERVTANLSLLVETKDTINKHEAWMESALKEDYAKKNQNVLINREFVARFKEEKHWTELKITKAYCRHEPSEKDYKLNLPPENFQKMINDCYCQYCA